MAELKKCPFCGGETYVSTDPEAARDSEGRLWAFTVVCKKCCATSGLLWSAEKAIESWNNRVNEADIRAKAIDEFVDEMKKEIFFTVDVLRRIDEIAEQLKGE